MQKANIEFILVTAQTGKKENEQFSSEPHSKHKFSIYNRWRPWSRCAHQFLARLAQRSNDVKVISHLEFFEAHSNLNTIN